MVGGLPWVSIFPLSSPIKLACYPSTISTISHCGCSHSPLEFSPSQTRPSSHRPLHCNRSLPLASGKALFITRSDMSNRWQGPTAAVTWGGDFQHIRVYGIDYARRIAEWKRDDNQAWQAPVVIEDTVKVAEGGVVSAIVSENSPIVCIILARHPSMFTDRSVRRFNCSLRAMMVARTSKLATRMGGGVRPLCYPELSLGRIRPVEAKV